LAPERARIGVERAAINLEQAEISLQRTLSGQDAARAAIEANRALEDAQLAVRDATVGVENADIRLRDAHFAVKDAAVALERAEFAVKEQKLQVRSAALAVEEAERAELNARQALIDQKTVIEGAELAVKQAHLGVKQAAAEAAFAQEDLVDAELAVAGQSRSTEERVAALRDRFGEMAGKVKEANVLLVDLLRLIGKIPNVTSENVQQMHPGPSAVIIQSRQHGGSLAARQLSLVGEKGPELFVPRSPGFVIPADLTASLFALTKILAAGNFRIRTDTRDSRPSQTLNFHEGAFQLPSIPNVDVLATAIARKLSQRSRR
jgi:hypothetical protein